MPANPKWILEPVSLIMFLMIKTKEILVSLLAINFSG